MKTATTNRNGALTNIDRRREVTPLSVAERTQRRPRVIDVREPFETLAETGHIPGSESVPLNRLADAARRWPRERALIIVDNDGSIAPGAAATLAQLGFTDVVWMSGGMRAWRRAQLPVAFAPESTSAAAAPATPNGVS